MNIFSYFFLTWSNFYFCAHILIILSNTWWMIWSGQKHSVFSKWTTTPQTFLNWVIFPIVLPSVDMCSPSHLQCFLCCSLVSVPPWPNHWDSWQGYQWLPCHQRQSFLPYPHPTDLSSCPTPFTILFGGTFFPRLLWPTLSWFFSQRPWTLLFSYYCWLSFFTFILNFGLLQDSLQSPFSFSIHTLSFDTLICFHVFM